MIFELRFTDEAKDGLYKLAKHEPKAFQKASWFIEELQYHPKTGLGHPEPLRANRKEDGVERLRGSTGLYMKSSKLK